MTHGILADSWTYEEVSDIIISHKIENPTEINEDMYEISVTVATLT